jgi:hypothetical protein
MAMVYATPDQLEKLTGERIAVLRAGIVQTGARRLYARPVISSSRPWSARRQSSARHRARGLREP